LIKVPFLKMHPSAKIPSQANPFDAGYDLYSIEAASLKPFQRQAINTGIAIALPKNCVGLVHPRSGLALKQGIGLLNSPGTIDSGYRGEIKVILINLDAENTFEISPGDRIAQLIIQEFSNVTFELVAELPESERGAGGFGSSGK
jgi:dUTP pyrophosphatase